MDKQPVGQLPDLTQSNNDNEIMVITDSEHNQLKKEKISDFITDLTSTDENNALGKGTDGKLFTKDFGNASNIIEGTLPVSVLPSSGVTADTYEYPSSVTVNEKGQVTAITEGTPSGNNANVDLSNITEAAKEVIRENSGSGFNLFDIVVKDHVLTFEESKGYALQGTYVYKDAVSGSRYGYPDFYAKCVEEKEAGTETQTQLGDSTITTYNNANGHIFYDIADKAVVDAFYESTGAAWFYGVDTVNERIFLPRNDWFFQSGNADNVGKFIEAGLPNIEGTINSIPYGQTEGAFSSATGSNVSSGTTAAGYKVTFDASLSNSIYGKSSTVQPPSVNTMYYMVVGNTEVTSAATDIVDITTSENDTLPLYFNIWSAQDLTTTGTFVNASLGSYLSGNVWTTVYNDLVSKIGQSFCAGEVKAYGADGITDYDCVVKQDDMTFRLPLKNGQEVMFATKAKGNGMSLGLTNGTSNEGLGFSGDGIVIHCQNAYGKSVGTTGQVQSRTGGMAGITTDASKSGIVIDTDNIQIPEGFNLYFKLGNALQNQQIIDVAAILSALNAKTDAAQAANASMPSGKYIDLTLGESGDTYTAPADGYILFKKNPTASSQFIAIESPANNLQISVYSTQNRGGIAVYLPVKKNSEFTVRYSMAGETDYFRFIYAQGSVPASTENTEAQND